MSDAWFVDEEHKVLEGERAGEEIGKRSDARFLTEGAGIVKVPLERWKVAQAYEKKGWMEAWAGAWDDRNQDHFDEFEGYGALRGRTFEHAIELGCGPFTNLRLIGNAARVRRCTLLDPLLDSYLTHRNCWYDRRRLRVQRRHFAFFYRNRFLFQVKRFGVKVAPWLFYSSIPVAELIPRPIEEMQVEGRSHDLVILINVIEHCYDAEKVFDRIRRICRSGTVLVFHEKYYDHEQVRKLVEGRFYEAGHPILPDRKVIDGFLEGSFDAVFRKVVRKPIPHIKVFPHYDGLYFIGKFR